METRIDGLEQDMMADSTRVLYVGTDPTMGGVLAGFGRVISRPPADAEGVDDRGGEEAPDLIVLDESEQRKVDLRWLTGLKRHASKAPQVVVLTHITSPRYRAKWLDLGADQVLTKPVHRVEFISTVRAALRRRRGVVMEAKPDAAAPAVRAPAEPHGSTQIRPAAPHAFPNATRDHAPGGAAGADGLAAFLSEIRSKAAGRLTKAPTPAGPGSVRGPNGAVARSAERPNFSPAKANLNAASALRKVLVVDDSGTAILRLRKIVEESGQYEVVGQALNGAEAVRLYKALQPDVVLMDILMPVMSGLQALKVILDHDREAKVIMVSTIGAMGTAAIQALRMGARAVLAKPCESEEVMRSLGKLS